MSPRKECFPEPRTISPVLAYNFELHYESLLIKDCQIGIKANTEQWSGNEIPELPLST